ncbi:hypothetical protein FOPG_19449 [Fusarium oxysporum f. sp. conglutinans race 2 54008]|uniref:Uncharacterized protein n=1 Tax=Fusarium oxysporum f. sp. conglutinans race 2 54008 TaxID=1089457 RepID=X0GWT8_FUSOX|nr:hypothetical protein FOPG_19449 [Fusarium oxysporum f. sp. conglutinans race 2 54008]
MRSRILSTMSQTGYRDSTTSAARSTDARPSWPLLLPPRAKVRRQSRFATKARPSLSSLKMIHQYFTPRLQRTSTSSKITQVTTQHRRQSSLRHPRCIPQALLPFVSNKRLSKPHKLEHELRSGRSPSRHL